MNQNELSETAKQDFLVIGGSVCARIPIVEPYIDFIMAGIMPEGYKAFVFPLVRRVYQDFLIGLCFRRLPSDNIFVTTISPYRQIVKNFLLQAHGTGGMDDVVHIRLERYTVTISFAGSPLTGQTDILQ